MTDIRIGPGRTPPRHLYDEADAGIDLAIVEGVAGGSEEGREIAAVVMYPWKARAIAAALLREADAAEKRAEYVSRTQPPARGQLRLVRLDAQKRPK